MNQKIYKSIADALVREGYVVIPKAIGLSRKLQALAKDLSGFKRAGISDVANVHVDSSRRRDKIRWLDQDDNVQSEFLAFSEGLREYLNRDLFLGLNYYEAHFAVYGKGDFYETHIDAFKNSVNRVVTTVYYLNDDWKKDDGGELVLYDEEGSLLQMVLPESDTLVVFLSEKFPHEVLPAQKKRYSIAGWFRVDKIE